MRSKRRWPGAQPKITVCPSSGPGRFTGEPPVCLAALFSIKGWRLTSRFCFFFELPRIRVQLSTLCSAKVLDRPKAIAGGSLVRIRGLNFLFCWKVKLTSLCFTRHAPSRALRLATPRRPPRPSQSAVLHHAAAPRSTARDPELRRTCEKPPGKNPAISVHRARCTSFPPPCTPWPGPFSAALPRPPPPARAWRRYYPCSSPGVSPTPRTRSPWRPRSPSSPTSWTRRRARRPPRRGSCYLSSATCR